MTNFTQSQLRVSGEMHVEVMYYNEKLAVWDPLLEPVMDTEDNYRPWEVLFKVPRFTQFMSPFCAAVETRVLHLVPPTRSSAAKFVEARLLQVVQI